MTEKAQDGVIKHSGYAWKKVSPPVKWRPENDKDELIGVVMSIASVHGPYGSYTRVMVSSYDGCYYVQGKCIAELVLAGGVAVNDLVKVVQTKVKTHSQSGNKYPVYDLYVGEVR